MTEVHEAKISVSDFSEIVYLFPYQCAPKARPVCGWCNHSGGQVGCRSQGPRCGGIVVENRYGTQQRLLLSLSPLHPLVQHVIHPLIARPRHTFGARRIMHGRIEERRTQSHRSDKRKVR